MSTGARGAAEPAEDLERLNHYQALGLTEAASSKAVSRGLWVERWPWHLLTEEARREATRRRVLAYGVLNDPHSRREYDRELGLTWRILAARVGELEALWGQVWLISLVVLAVLMVMAGPDDLARVIGANLAPGFKEEFVYHAAPPECAGCVAYLTREFRSSSDTWASFLNGWGIWIAPPLAVVLVGLAGKPLVNRAAGWAVAYVRFLGYRDTLTRAVLVALVLAVVIVMVALPVLSAPSPPPFPPGVG